MSDITERRYDLDWLRIGAFGLLIFYHIGMFYVSWPWHVKSSQTGPDVWQVVQPVMLLSNPWRLGLLFLIAGCATRFMSDKLPRGAMATARSWRLLPPLLFGMLVIVPPQTYYEVVEHMNFDEGWLAFYVKYIGFHDGWRSNGAPLIVPTWNHLWFVVYLWVYTMLVLALRPLLHRLPMQRMAALMRRPMALLLLPPLFVGLLRLTLKPVFGETHALLDDWYLHALYLSMFLFGYGIARQEGIWRSIENLRWIALTLAVAIYASMIVAVVTNTGGPARPFIWALDQWAWILMLLGFARRLMNFDSPARRYLTDAVFPFYIIHQTAIVVLGHHLTKLALPVGAEAVLLVLGTAMACFVGYEIVRRVSVLRPVFGLKEVSAQRGVFRFRVN
ncbi:acyltransferase family protein [Ferrovibrio sp.]|uniref:acyltransferase family protein n=1 Tax=Ferrovibrio sp. TaxID=1917215 RepID=UPI000CB68ABC|nr:acyltransferase family protein [Ferrovibrio sp.]PJI39611.1 MAG: acyltransferase [Ferrovibrio sp.]